MDEKRWSTFRYFWDYAGGAMTDWGVHLLDIVQFAFDEVDARIGGGAGRQVLCQGQHGNAGHDAGDLPLPGFVGSYESRTVNPFPMYNDTYGTAFHGTKATLMVNRGGYRIFPNEKGKEPVAETSKEMLGHERAALAQLPRVRRTRQKPISDIETCVRTTTTCILANLALRHGMTLDWDDKAFTVKQSEARQYLKPKYRSPWKLEV